MTLGDDTVTASRALPYSTSQTLERQHPWGSSPNLRLQRRTSKKGLEVAVEVPVPPGGALVSTASGGRIGLKGRVVVQARRRLVRDRELAAAALTVGRVGDLGRSLRHHVIGPRVETVTLELGGRPVELDRKSVV